MNLSRRRFLELVAGLAAASVPAVTAGCNGAVLPTPAAPPPSPEALLTQAAMTPLPPSATPTEIIPVAATTQPLSALSLTATPHPAATVGGNRRRVWTWLRMLQVGSIPTSESSYMAHKGDIDVVMPLNGGKLQADGTWLQEDEKTTTDWPQNLSRAARAAGQLYMPGMGNDRAGILKVLADTDLQEKAAADLARLAKSGRFDSPWDGVFLDLEGVAYPYRAQMSGFLYRLGRAVKAAGLLFGVSVGGVTQETTGTLAGDDANDLGVIGEIADFVDLRCYDYGGPPPFSIGPYWWIEAGIQYALKKGVKPGQMTGGLAAFAQYWPQADQGDSQQMTYDEALRRIREANAQVSWQESDENGPVRESYARLGPGYISLADEKSYRYGLELIDRYHLLGNTMFVPGMGNEAQWQVLSAWRTASR